MPQAILQCGSHQLSLERPLIMGIVNVTPDSFSDGGHFLRADAAIAHARQLLLDGADLLDIGGESTRPGAQDVPVSEEINRVLPVIEACRNWGMPLSIDTRKTEVMRAALAAGVSMVNDIAALEAPGALEAVAQSGAAVCLMHKQGEPHAMQKQPQYQDVLKEVRTYLAERCDAALQAGIAAERIVIDPGFGFGKTFNHNQTLFRQLNAFQQLPYPLLVGVSRKSMLGQILQSADGIIPTPVERDIASIAAAIMAVERGAAIVRVHAVKQTAEALKTWRALN